ncbi:MAG: 3'(2'),5'-bisphosphate nucleotidase CysQ, partial [Bacteroidota bacterium]
FIKRNGDFTVNIALIENNRPVLGVIFAPTHDTMYFGSKTEGAFKQVGAAATEKMEVNRKTENLVAVVSRSHAKPEDKAVMEEYKVKESISVGSSLKFCMVAEGKADIYFRSGPTMEWDTAAGQAILESAGGQMERLDGEYFAYNKESLLNSGFLCKGW